MAWPVAGSPCRQICEAVWLSLEPGTIGTRQGGGFENHQGAAEFFWGISSDCSRTEYTSKLNCASNDWQ